MSHPQLKKITRYLRVFGSKAILIMLARVAGFNGFD